MPPKIDQDKCNGCGECVNVCPTGALEVKKGKCVLARPNDCADCRACETACPNNAITF
jgi:NAD-dependent dihydropyrimidine dehydrogenase PreA subunit